MNTQETCLHAVCLDVVLHGRGKDSFRAKLREELRVDVEAHSPTGGDSGRWGGGRKSRDTYSVLCGLGWPYADSMAGCISLSLLETKAGAIMRLVRGDGLKHRSAQGHLIMVAQVVFLSPSIYS